MLELIEKNILRDKRAMLNRYLKAAQEIDQERSKILWQTEFEPNVIPRYLNEQEHLRLIELNRRAEALLKKAREEGLLPA